MNHQTDQSQSRWQNYAQEIRVGPGEFVFLEGDPSSALYIVEYGVLAVVKNARTPEQLVLNYRRAGEIIGEVSLISEQPRSASLMATEDSALIEISNEQFWELMDRDSGFRRTIMQTVVENLLQADQRRMEAATAEKAMYERLTTLGDEKDQLTEILNLRKQTMHFIVHDLRNPLSLIRLTLTMLADEIVEDSDLGNMVTLARSGVERMLGMVEGLLDVERLDVEDPVLERVSLDFIKLVDETLARHRVLAKTRDVDIQFRVEGVIPPLNVDSLRIERVINNLVDNAMKFTMQGELVVKIERDENAVRFSVMDTGPGIPEDKRDSIFERFIQAEPEKDIRRGYGLGLAFCKSAVNAHGGSIWVEDGDPGFGARFVFTLPITSTIGNAGVLI